jgi:hypothetical protein
MENIKSYVDRIWCSRHKSDVEQILIEYAQYKVNELNISDVSTSFTCDLEPKVTFIKELWVGKVKVPVRTELDFSGVHPLQHEKILEIAHKIYCVDKQVNGC